MHTTPLILIADDDPRANELLCFAFEQEAPDCRLEFVPDGRQAIDYLQGEPPFQDRPDPPDLLLLDIKMPYLDGFQLLEWLRRFPERRPKYVVNISTSDSQKDVERAGALGADAYLVKPMQFNTLLDQVRSLAALLRTGVMPPESVLCHRPLRATPLSAHTSEVNPGTQ